MRQGRSDSAGEPSVVVEGFYDKFWDAEAGIPFKFLLETTILKQTDSRVSAKMRMGRTYEKPW